MLEKVVKGQKINSKIVTAGTWNAFVDAARAHQLADRSGAGEISAAPRTGIVLVQNISANDHDQFSTLWIAGLAITPTDDEQRFRTSDPVFQVDEWASIAGPQEFRFVVLQEPIAAGAVGRAMIYGITPCTINVSDEADAYAFPNTRDPTAMTSGPAGQCRILWKAAGTGEVWAVVSLPESRNSVVRFCKVLENYVPADGYIDIVSPSAGSYHPAPAGVWVRECTSNGATPVTDGSADFWVSIGFLGGGFEVPSAGVLDQRYLGQYGAMFVTGRVFPYLPCEHEMGRLLGDNFLHAEVGGSFEDSEGTEYEARPWRGYALAMAPKQAFPIKITSTATTGSTGTLQRRNGSNTAWEDDPTGIEIDVVHTGSYEIPVDRIVFAYPIHKDGGTVLWAADWSLDNDQDSPGTRYVYGTSGTGARAWLQLTQITVVTDVRDNSGTIEKKTRSCWVYEPGGESSWTAI